MRVCWSSSAKRVEIAPGVFATYHQPRVMDVLQARVDKEKHDKDSPSPAPWDHYLTALVTERVDLVLDGEPYPEAFEARLAWFARLHWRLFTRLNEAVHADADITQEEE